MIYTHVRAEVRITDVRIDLHVARVGRAHECRVDIDKPFRQNDMGEKGFTCLDGFEYEPIFGKEAQRCDFLTRDGIVNKSDF
jgi:hypothetical protein